MALLQGLINLTRSLGHQRQVEENKTMSSKELLVASVDDVHPQDARDRRQCTRRISYHQNPTTTEHLNTQGHIQLKIADVRDGETVSCPLASANDKNGGDCGPEVQNAPTISSL